MFRDWLCGIYTGFRHSLGFKRSGRRIWVVGFSFRKFRQARGASIEKQTLAGVKTPIHTYIYIYIYVYLCIHLCLRKVLRFGVKGLGFRALGLISLNPKALKPKPSLNIL